MPGVLPDPGELTPEPPAVPPPPELPLFPLPDMLLDRFEYPPYPAITVKAVDVIVDVLYEPPAVKLKLTSEVIVTYPS